MVEEFRKVCEHIFSNWTALKLAVEHSMGGPDSRTTAIQSIEYMIGFCLNESKGDVEAIQDALDDILDEEFDVICEDGSTKQVAEILVKFMGLISNNPQGFQEEYQKLPPVQDWLISPQPRQPQRRQIMDSSDDDEDNNSEKPAVVDSDMEWTVVSRKKR